MGQVGSGPVNPSQNDNCAIMTPLDVSLRQFLDQVG